MSERNAEFSAPGKLCKRATLVGWAERQSANLQLFARANEVDREFGEQLVGRLRPYNWLN
jgi:hypothetical protein